MNKIPTAEEFWIDWKSGYKTSDALIAFAKLHLEVQKEAILKNACILTKPYFEATNEEQLKGSHIYEDNGSDRPSYLAIVDKDSIINAYNINNVK